MIGYGIPFVVASLPALIWAWFVAPRLVRRLGVPIPLKWRERKDLRLTLDQSVLSSVLSWGVCMVIYDRTCHAILWVWYHQRADEPTFWRIAGSILLWVTGSVVMGLFSAAPAESENGI
jgi:hypothetical protein